MIKDGVQESILVCVYYGPNGERLIRRGCAIANMMKCPVYILTIDSMPIDEMNAEKVYYIDRWKKLAQELNATQFIIKDNEKRPVAKVIGEVAREKHVTQIIIGQTAQSRWEQITKGSLINTLLHEIPFVDLHIISVSRYIKDEEGLFEQGIRAYLIQEGDQFKLTFQHSKMIAYEGIFFKENGTDFDNGIFRFLKDNEMLQVQVTDGIVDNLTSVPMAAPYEEEQEEIEDEQ